MDGQCRCNAIGPGVQTFRLRNSADLFDVVVTLDGIANEIVDSRAVWACRDCGQHFAWLRIFYKDHEEIIVRAPTSDWRNWDWEALAAIADACRWRGPGRDAKYVL